MSSAPLSRRALVTGTLSAGLVGSFVPLRYARAAEFVFKLGTDVPETHPINIHARRAADAIRAQTDGRVDLQIFSNNQLGGQSDMLSQLRSGALECFALSGVNVLSTIIPTSSIYGLGFAFPNYDAVRSRRPASSSWSGSGTTGSARSPTACGRSASRRTSRASRSGCR
jgi:TRAP-type transport system periplasmic protein